MKWVQNIHLRKCPRAESMRIQIILSKHWMVWIITWWTMGSSFPKAQDPRTPHRYMAHLTILESMEWAHWWSPQWSSPIDAMHYILSTQKTEQYWVLILLHPYNACSSQELAKIWLQSSRRSIRWGEPKAHYQCSSDPHWNVNKTKDKWPKTWHTNLLTNKRTIPLQFGPPTLHFTFTQFISYLSAHSYTSLICCGISSPSLIVYLLTWSSPASPPWSCPILVDSTEVDEKNPSFFSFLSYIFMWFMSEEAAF